MNSIPTRRTRPGPRREPSRPTAPGRSARKRSAPALVALRFVAFLGLAAAALGGLAFTGYRVTAAQNKLPYSTDAFPSVAAPDEPAPGTLVVAVVLGTSATVATDAMGPYEVFARSSRFSVYTVSDQAGPADVEGAPTILPDYTFAEVNARADLTPDVIVVPAVADPTGAAERPTREWVLRMHEQGAHILSVCAGARLVAETGLLDGRTATSHWSRLAALRDRHPETTWVAGQRFVRDGDITTTAGITSGIPGALSVIHDLAGTTEAQTVGGEVGYPGWTPDGPTSIPIQSWGLADRPVVLNSLLPWLRPTIAISLENGVGEIDTASVFEVYSNSAAARTLAVSPTGFVETAHGLRLLTLSEQQAPDVDATLRPGVTGPSGRAGFDGALEQLAGAEGAATARATAKMIDYPSENLRLGATGGPRRTEMLSLAAIALATLAGLAPAALRRRPRSPRP